MSEGSALRVRSRNSSLIPNSGDKRKSNGNTSRPDLSELNKNKKASIQVDYISFRFSNGTGLAISLGASVVLALCLWLYSHRRTGVPAMLPETYALCSPKGSNIYTVNANNQKVQCIVVKGSKVIDMGYLGDIQTRWSQKHQTVERNSSEMPLNRSQLTVRFIPTGAIVVPGLSDSHGHILEYGASRQLPLEGAKDSKAVVARVKDFILRHPDVLNDRTRFVEGWGWDHTAWPAEVFPHFAELEADPIVRGRPIILQSKDGHALWVSESIINSSAPFPDEVDGGVIVRDSERQPTGVFLDNAQDLLKKPPLTEADRLQRFMFAVNDAHAWGLTSLHDAGFNPASLAFFRSQAQLSNLPIRVYGMTFFDENARYWGDKRDKIFNLNRLTARSVKIFADGALRSGGAALYEPYTDNPETNGFMRIDPQTLYTFVPKFLEDGWQVNIHAIGDRANAIVLDVLESALKDINVTQARPRIEHAQIMLPKDMKRLAKLGVIASVQPTHVVSDMWYAQERLGPERVKNLYAFRSIVDAGARITLGSDFPVEDLNPLSGFHAAVTRLSPDNRSPHGIGGWFPEERLTRIEALRGKKFSPYMIRNVLTAAPYPTPLRKQRLGMTIDPAYASFSEEYLGSLEVGKLADYAVFSQDFMSVPDEDILKTEVLATVIDGRIVYGRF